MLREDLIYIKKKNKFFTLIWLLLLLELSVFFYVAYVFSVPDIPEKNISYKSDFNIIFMYVSYIIVIAAVPFTYKICEKRKKAVSDTDNIKIISEKYLVTLLIIYSVSEFAAIMILAAFYLNATYEPLYMFGIIYIAVLLRKPSLAGFMKKKRNKDISITEKNNIRDTENILQENEN
ncbi:MAG: hypothetical protein GXO50_04430 [Chlorobi bacterium]|nr:hypothetical protein [Chlorobiota bacterium]